MNLDSFRLDGKRSVVVGGATGMGAATAVLAQNLGAEVVVMDVAPITMAGVRSISLDLRDAYSIDTALAECGGPIDVLFSCAGVADGVPGIEKINFIGHRHLIDGALAAGYLTRGSAIGMISSSAGLAWEKNLEKLKEYLDTPDFDSAVAWVHAHPGTADYMWSKQAMCAYVARQAFPMSKLGIRINAILPGPTDTPLARSQADLWLGFGADYREAAGIKASTPEEQAAPLVFLCTDAARQINGVTLVSDGGYVSSGITGSFPAATPSVDFLYGRY
jgi:NAD(P)-dependent dehydrogenase (short-subunit alcohol dehydrogenase family)